MEEDRMPDEPGTSDLDSGIRRARILTWVCVAAFVLFDVVGLTAPDQADPRFVIGAFGGAATFLGLIAAGVWWAYLASQRRARRLDSRLDRELRDEEVRSHDRREPPAP